MTTPQDDVFVGTGMAARYLGVSEASVIRWANAGQLPCVRTGSGYRRFRLGDLNQFLNAGRNSGTPRTEAAASGS